MTEKTLHLRGYSIAPPHAIVQFDRGPDWMTNPRRACAPQHGNDDLFTSELPLHLNQAAAICLDQCPFVAECDAWATETRQTYGAWGGRIYGSTAKAPADEAPIATMHHQVFAEHTPEQQAAALREALDDGASLGKLAQRYQRPISELQKILGIVTLDEIVEASFHGGISDQEIAQAQNVNPKTIAGIRSRLGLTKKAGRPRKPVPS